MMDFNFRTLNVESLAQKNKEDAMNAIRQLGTPRSHTLVLGREHTPINSSFSNN